MATVTIFKPADLTINVVDGNPPVDQTAEVAALQAQVAVLQADLASMTALRDAAVSAGAVLQAKIDAAKPAVDAAKAALA